MHRVSMMNAAMIILKKKKHQCKNLWLRKDQDKSKTKKKEINLDQDRDQLKEIVQLNLLQVYPKI